MNKILMLVLTLTLSSIASADYDHCTVTISLWKNTLTLKKDGNSKVYQLDSTKTVTNQYYEGLGIVVRDIQAYSSGDSSEPSGKVILGNGQSLTCDIVGI